MPLTDAKLMSLGAARAAAQRANLKTRKVTDSEGLYILLPPTGSMPWRFAYRVGGKQKVLALGKYPDVSLAKARKAAIDARALVADGHDPSVERKRAKVRAKARRAFGGQYRQSARTRIRLGHDLANVSVAR